MAVRAGPSVVSTRRAVMADEHLSAPPAPATLRRTTAGRGHGGL